MRLHCISFFQNMNAPSLWPLQMFHLVLGVLVIRAANDDEDKEDDVSELHFFGICCAMFF